MAETDPLAPLSADSPVEFVLHINAVGAVVGGAVRHLEPFLHELGKDRPEWRIAVWVTEGSAIGSISSEDIEMRTVPPLGRLSRIWWEMVTLPKELRRAGASALLNLTNSGPLRAGVPSLLYQRNALYFDRSWLDRLGPAARFDAWLRRTLTFAQLRGSHVAIVPSAAMGEYLTSWPGFPRCTEVHVIPHGVDTARFAFTRHVWPPPIDRPLRLVSIGHAGPQKDHGVLPQMMAELVSRGHDVRLGITMDRKDSPAVVDAFIESARRHVVLDRIDLLGAVSDAERLYGSADLMILPSISESFGFPVVEAMACGIPVIGSRIDATVELLGRNGWYFATGDAVAAADAIELALATPQDEVLHMLRVANESARSLSWERNVKKVVAAIERCTAR